MNMPSSSELLHTWDAGSGRDHTSRALLLLQTACPEPVDGDPADLNVGRRDGLLLDLREGLFGSQIDAFERCPECGADLEFTFDVADIRAGDIAVVDGPVGVEIDGYNLLARLPTSRDLYAISGCRDLHDARDQLMARCLLDVDESGQSPPYTELPIIVRDELARALSLADPQAVVTLALECAVCGHDWQTHFDIVEYLWAEMEQLGRRMLRDVHTLATSYGWSESAILALSPQRRRIYLEMVSHG